MRGSKRYGSFFRSRALGALLASATFCAFCASCSRADTPVRDPNLPSGGRDLQLSTASATLKMNAEGFLEEYLRENPTRATELGDHRFDGRWPDLSREAEAAERARAVVRLTDVEATPEAGLSREERVDRGLLINQLKYAIFGIDELKDAETDPLLYTRLVGDGLDPLVTRSFGTQEERLTALRDRLRGIPRIVATAKARLGRPARVFTETAIAQNAGLVALCKNELPAEAAKVPALTESIVAAARAAATSLEDYGAFLQREVLPRSDGSFRLGRARFEKKLRLELDDAVEIDDVAKGARALLDKTLAEMTETARELWPEVMKPAPLPPLETLDQRRAAVKRVLDKLAEDRPDNATIVREASDWLARASAFVKEHDLVGFPSEPCRVIEMPEYRRGVAVAYCDSSGPLEAKQETFYAIAPTPKDWAPARAESFFREYNRSMLADLTVHEAMPGHFLQLMHNNAPAVAGQPSGLAGKLRSVFSSGAFVEGWAVYAEWLMSKYGFGGPKVRMMRQKMVLRLAANAILDHGIHAGSMEEREALDLMMHDAFQEEGEAVGKWKRARLSSAQLTTYYYGFTEMMRLRAQNEGKPGFSERTYHDRVIGSGSPSMRALRTLFEG